MKRVYLPLSLLTLVLIGLTPAFSAGSPDVAASKKKGTIPPDLRLTKVKAKQSQAKQSQKDLAVKIGRENHDAYLTYDHMDVYVATSMRQRHEFHMVHGFIKELFLQLN